MPKPRVIIADENTGYIVPLQFKFVKEFFDEIDLEIITQKEYFDDFFSRPQNAELLIISDELYDSSLKKHNIDNVFVMTENDENDITDDLNVNKIYKYTSIKEIFNVIVGKSNGVLNIGSIEKKDCQIVLVTSATGGAGKTTISMGIAASLSKNYRRVLYINASRLQNFQYMLDNDTPISDSEIYSKLINPSVTVYNDIRHVIRTELFSYLPAFKAALMSLGIDYSIFEKVALAAKKSGDYDYIVVDAEGAFDEYMTTMLGSADKVVVVTEQTNNSIQATNCFVANINGVNSEKYVFICNKFSTENYNALIIPDQKLKFTVTEYVNIFDNYEQMKVCDFVKQQTMQKVSVLL